MIYVVGCNHGIQAEKIGDTQENTQERTEQRTSYAELIEATLREGEIQFVGEEWGTNGTTIAHAVANKHGIPWANINTSPADLKQMRIHPFYTKLRCPPGRKAKGHDQRERFMLHKIQESRGQAKNLLVICGFDHMLPLSDLLREENAEVKFIDYRNRDWFRRGVFFEDNYASWN